MAHPGMILVADDNADTLAVIAECLRDEGYTIVAAPSADEAVRALAGTPFALVVTATFENISASGPSPWATLDRIREAAGATPIIICSAYAERLFADYKAHGFAAFLEKPFDLDALCNLVRQAIESTPEGS